MSSEGQPDDTGADAMHTRFVFEVHVKIGERIALGPTPQGERAIVPILGGHAEGPDFQGEVLPGADWQLKRADGVWELEARYALRARDGAVVQIVNCGLLVLPSESRDGGLYLRTAPIFAAPKDGPHAWLNRSLFVGKLVAGSANHVHLRFYWVL